MVGVGLVVLILLAMLICCLWRNCHEGEEGEKESVVGVTEREMVIGSKMGEKDF